MFLQKSGHYSRDYKQCKFTMAIFFKLKIWFSLLLCLKLCLMLIFNSMILTIQEKQFNVERTNTTLKEKNIFFFQFVFILWGIKVSVPCLARPSTPEQHGLIIALFRFFHCNIWVVQFVHFVILVFSFYFLSHVLFIVLTIFPLSVHSYPYSIHAHMSMLFSLHLSQ